MVVSVVKGVGGGIPLINMGSLKLFFSSFLRGINPQSGSVYPHSDFLGMKGWRGKPLIPMGLLKLFSSTPLVITGELTHRVVPYANTVVVCVVTRGDP